ncbi:hypothetical protein NQ318_008101, partial [Aromia moschata]
MAVLLDRMPRIYKKKLGPQGECNYAKTYVERPVAAVRRGSMSMRRASVQYGVPYSTIQRRFHGTQSLKYGRQPVLSDEQEDRIKTSLQLCAEWRFPLKSNDVRGVVQQYLNKLGVTERRFKDNLPGLDWFKSFMKRHPELTIKLAENTKRVRAGLIQEYFQHLEQSIANIPPFNIINYDETNFADDPGSVKVVTKRGAKHTHRTIDSSKSSTTVMFAIAADGTLLPPYVVYKAKHSYEGWTQGGIEGSRYNRSVSGLFDSELFEDWFITIAIPYFRRLNGPKVLIGDNLNSHITNSVIEECENNEIKFVLLPPNSTHLLQPLYVAYFRPLKACWRNILEKWKIKHRGVVPKTEFPRLLKETIETVGIRSMENSIAGFKACGIYPLDPNKVLNKIPRNNPANETDHNEQAWTQAIVEHLNRLKVSTATAVKRETEIEDEEEPASNFSDLSEDSDKENENESMSGPSTSVDPFDRDSDESTLQETNQRQSLKSQESTNQLSVLENMTLE